MDLFKKYNRGGIVRINSGCIIFYVVRVWVVV